MFPELELLEDSKGEEAEPANDVSKCSEQGWSEEARLGSATKMGAGDVPY